MSDPFEIVEALARKERVSQEARTALGQVLSDNIISPSPASALFNSILLRFELKEDCTHPTGYTDGQKIWYNPEFVLANDHDQREWFLDHEALHIGLAHPARMNFCEDQELANVAADLVVNHILREAGLRKWPTGILFPGEGEYRDIEPGLDFESTYERLLKKKQKDQPKPEEEEEEEEEEQEDKEEEGEGEGEGEDEDEEGEGEDEEGEGEGESEGKEGEGEGKGSGGAGQPVPDPGQCGGVARAGDGSPAAASQQEAEASVIMAEAEAISSSIGTLPGALKRLVEASRKRPQDWRARLRDWVTRRAKSRLGWDRPRAWAISRGIYLPGRSGKQLGKIILSVDVSGSCWGEPLNQFANEMQSLAEEFRQPLLIVYSDSRINLVEEFDPELGLPLTLKAVGGGGTDHNPLFEWIKREHPDAQGVLCFTDLYTCYPASCDVPVLWAAPRTGLGDLPDYCKPPFGEVILL